MKVLLYAKNRQVVLKSGVGRAMVMQEESLKGNGVEVTTDPKDDYDVVHINTIFPSDYFMAKKAKKWREKSSLSRPFYKRRFSKLLHRFESDCTVIQEVDYEMLSDRRSDFNTDKLFEVIT